MYALSTYCFKYKFPLSWLFNISDIYCVMLQACTVVDTDGRFTIDGERYTTTYWTWRNERIRHAAVVNSHIAADITNLSLQRRNYEWFHPANCYLEILNQYVKKTWHVEMHMLWWSLKIIFVIWTEIIQTSACYCGDIFMFLLLWLLLLELWLLSW